MDSFAPASDKHRAVHTLGCVSLGAADSGGSLGRGPAGTQSPRLAGGLRAHRGV